MSKTADLLILRPFSQDSPGSVSTGETPRQKMSKVVAPRDTKPDSGRESTKDTLSSVPDLFRKGKLQTVTFETGQSQNKLGSEIWAGVSRSRDFHEKP